jgi:hypothetical protein
MDADFDDLDRQHVTGLGSADTNQYPNANRVPDQVDRRPRRDQAGSQEGGLMAKPKLSDDRRTVTVRVPIYQATRRPKTCARAGRHGYHHGADPPPH